MLIGLYGKARSGKDTVATYLGRTRGFQTRAFADPMYDMLAAGMGIHMTSRKTGLLRTEQINELPYCIYVNDHDKDSVVNPFGVSVRRLMQTLGTEWGRNVVGEDVWVTLADAWYQQHRQGHVVFTDVRFPNEADFILSNGGQVVEVYRPQEDFAAFRQHDSENQLMHSYVGHTLNNAGSLDDLFTMVDHLLHVIDV